MRHQNGFGHISTHSSTIHPYRAVFTAAPDPLGLSLTSTTHTLSLHDIGTPVAVIDRVKMQANIDRLQRHMDALEVRLRPHVKTTKNTQVADAQRQAGARGITVSTLKEAEAFFEAGETDILYAVGMAAHKLPQALALRRRGCDLKILTDDPVAAASIVAYGNEHNEVFEVWIEIDTDGHRSGIKPDSEALLEVGRILTRGGQRLGGVLTHAGSSYELNTHAALVALAEQERAGCVLAAERLRASGMPCEHVSVGSTPTAFAVEHLEGVTEVRAGVYAMFDLVMSNVGVCNLDDIALSVVTTVIGHQAEKGWVIVDAGWMAMSRDRGTQRLGIDYGYGQVCNLAGTPYPGLLMTGANQEHGIISLVNGQMADVANQFPIGTRLRILPNHACATGAQYPAYSAVDAAGNIESWPRLHGW